MSRQKSLRVAPAPAALRLLLPLTKLVSLVVTRSASGLCLLFLIFPVRRSEVMPVLEA
jgi:hypothetical protein